VQQLEILARDWIFVVLAEVAEVVCVVKVFQPGWVASEFLVVGPDCARVLHSAMYHFQFPVPPDLKRNCRKRNRRRDGHQCHDQKHREQDIALFMPGERSRVCGQSLHWNSNNLASDHCAIQPGAMQRVLNSFCVAQHKTILA